MKRFEPFRVTTVLMAAVTCLGLGTLLPAAPIDRLSGRPVESLVAMGPELQISDPEAYGASYVRAGRAVARTPDGNFVVVWNQRTAGGGIFARRYASDGAALGTEIRLTPNGLFVGNPAVAALDGERFVVVYDDIDTDGAGVFGQLVDADDTVPGGDFLVNSSMAGVQRHADVAAVGDGELVIVWSDEGRGDAGELMARRYTDQGFLVGSAFQVNTYTTGPQRGASIASAGDGAFVVAWQSGDATHDGPDGDGATIALQRFSAASAKVGGELVVNSFTTGGQTNPDVHVASDAAIVTAWQTQLGDTDGSSAIAARRLEAGTSVFDTEIEVNVHTAGEQEKPSLAGADGGAFVVAWQSGDPDGIPDGPDGSDTAVRARGFASDGSASGAEIGANLYTAGFQKDISVVPAGDGAFLAVWAGESALEEDGLVARMLAPGVTTTTLAASTTTVSASSTTIPASETTILDASTTTLDSTSTTLDVATTLDAVSTTTLSGASTLPAPTTTMPASSTTMTSVASTSLPPITTTTLADEPARCGDPVATEIKGNGKSPRAYVTSADALFALRAAVGLAECELCVCDVDGSSERTAADALFLLRVAVGSETELFCPLC